MFSDPFVCPIDNGTSLTKSFVLVQNGGAGVLRINSEADTGAYPHVLKVAHTVVGKGTAIRDRHLARFETSSVDGSLIGTQLPLVGYLVVDFPRSCINSAASWDLLKTMSGFIRGISGNASPDASVVWDRFLRNEG